MADTSALEAAIIARLTADATLTALAPGGVFMDVSKQGVTYPCVIVTQTSHEDNYQLGNSAAYESALFLVKVVDASTAATAAEAAYRRVHTLLQLVTLTITGYTCLDCVREERTAYVELDADSDRRFQHRGGFYRVVAEATA